MLTFEGRRKRSALLVLDLLQRKSANHLELVKI